MALACYHAVIYFIRVEQLYIVYCIECSETGEAEPRTFVTMDGFAFLEQIVF